MLYELEVELSLNALFDANFGGGMEQLKVLKRSDGKSFDIFHLGNKTIQSILYELADDYINRRPETDAEKKILGIFEKLRNCGTTL